MHTVIRSHEICAGHRVVGHESKCRHLHGHNYVFHFKVQPNRPARLVMSGSLTGGKLKIKDPDLDSVGRVVDFSVVKTTLCQWLEDNWDHKFLHWEKDALVLGLVDLVNKDDESNPNDMSMLLDDRCHFLNSLVSLPFNPTAENLAQYMVDVIGPQLLTEHGVELVACTIEETSKCHVEYTK